MKKKLIAVFCICVFLVANSAEVSFADEIKIGRLNAVVYNDMWKKFQRIDLEIRYNTSLAFYMFQFNPWSTETSIIVLMKAQRQALLNAINKFEKWQKLAILKQVTLEKNLATLPGVSIGWFSDGDFHGEKNVAISADFLSQNKNDHVLVLKFPKVTSRSNEFLDHKPETLYFFAKQLAAFKKTLFDSYIDQAITTNKVKKKSVDADFQ